MTVVVTIHSPGAAAERRTLAGPAQAGGSRADGILLPGVAAGALRLSPRGSGVVIEAAVAGVRVAGHPVPPGTRRFLRAGERAEVQGSAIALDAGAPAEGTRAAAGALLRDAAAGDHTDPGPRLVVLTGPCAGDRHPLLGDRTLGRGRAAGIRIADPHASRVHARVRLGADGAATIEDLRSKNGVRVNGVRVDRRPHALAPGDEIAIGDTVLALEDPFPLRQEPAPAAKRPASDGPSGGPGRRSRRLAAAALLAVSAAALALAAS